MIRIAQVVAVHPARRTVEIVFCDNGQRCAEVPIMSGVVTTDGGVWALPSVQRPATEVDAGSRATSGRTVFAACGFAENRPVVLGFFQPNSGKLRPSEQDRAIYRHPSGSYAMVAPDGTIEVKHSSGAFLRIGDGSASPAVPGVPAGSGAAPTVTVKTENVSLIVAPDGTVTLDADGNVAMTAPNFHITGNVQITGNLGVTGTGGGAAIISMTGHIDLTGDLDATAEVKAAGIPLSTHRHTGVQAGGGTTGLPTT